MFCASTYNCTTNANQCHLMPRLRPQHPYSVLQHTTAQPMPTDAKTETATSLFSAPTHNCTFSGSWRVPAVLRHHAVNRLHKQSVWGTDADCWRLCCVLALHQQPVISKGTWYMAMCTHLSSFPFFLALSSSPSCPPSLAPPPPCLGICVLHLVLCVLGMVQNVDTVALAALC